MKYISLLNPITIKYLWDNLNTKYFIINLLKQFFNENEEYELLNYFSDESQNVRSYTIFKTKSKIIIMDYNINENESQLNDDLDIMNFIKETTNEKPYLLYFSNKSGTNLNEGNIYIVRKNSDNNSYVKFLLASNFKEQQKYDFNDITNYLYNLDEYFLKRYLKEKELLYNYK
ncbi:MAG: hypothetical protein Q4C33_00625 [bacterium]|nr:hypothetical protein [bacterium]